MEIIIILKLRLAGILLFSANIMQSKFDSKINFLSLIKHILYDLQNYYKFHKKIL